MLCLTVFWRCGALAAAVALGGALPALALAFPAPVGARPAPVLPAPEKNVFFTVHSVPALGRPSGLPLDVPSGFLRTGGKAHGRPVGEAIDPRGALLVAGGVGHALWRAVGGSPSSANASPASAAPASAAPAATDPPGRR